MATVIDTTSVHYKGKFASVYEVNKVYPNGGTVGDYVDILGFAHYWNPDRGSWTVNEQRDAYWDALLQQRANEISGLSGRISEEVDNRKKLWSEMQNTVSKYTAKVDVLEGRFKVMSKAAYDNLGTKEGNCFYFLYE